MNGEKKDGKESGRRRHWSDHMSQFEIWVILLLAVGIVFWLALTGRFP